MALVLAQKREKKDPLDYLVQGLQIANSYYGIKADMAKLDEHKARTQKQKDIQQGIYDKGDQASFTQAGLDVSPYKEGAPVPQGSFIGKDKDSGSPLLVSIRAKAPEKLIKEVPLIKGNVRGVAVMDYGGPQPKELSFTPDAPKNEKIPTRLIEETDSQGNTIQRIVEDRPGQQFSAKTDLNKMSPGYKKRDEEFAKEYSSFADRGGFAEISKDLGELEAISQKLETGSYTGPLQGAIPDFIRKGSNEEAINIREGVRRIAQKNIRLLLGPQFTEKEGQQILERAFDERVSETENKRRVDSLIERIRTKAEQLLSAGKYFENKGTLKGFGSAEDIGKSIAKKDELKKDPPPGGDSGDALGADRDTKFDVGSRVKRNNKVWVKHQDGLWYEE